MSKKKRIKRSSRNKEACAATKLFLIQTYGTRCWLCNKEFHNSITHHHIIPRYAGGSDGISNGSLLCTRCQVYIHTYTYPSDIYMDITERILKHKEELDRV